MIRTAKFIFCDNEHGMGDMTYPDLFGDIEELRQHFLNNPTLKQLRKDAKKAGWSRHEGRGLLPAMHRRRNLMILNGDDIRKQIQQAERDGAYDPARASLALWVIAEQLYELRQLISLSLERNK